MIHLLFVIFALLFFSVRPAHAADFLVDFHVPSGQPVFSSENLKPGDSVTRTIDVQNTTSTPREAVLRGVWTGGDGDDPPLEHSLFVTIRSGATVLYGSGAATGTKTVLDLFTDSSMPNFVVLGTIAGNQTASYVLTVDFPPTAGNEYQGKSVSFDLMIDTRAQINTQRVLINEVYYHVDRSHWHGLSPDRRDNDRDLDDGGWYRDWWWQRRWWVYKKDFQWIELYNPTDNDISLRGWAVTTKDKTRAKFERRDVIKARGFVLIAKDRSVWRYWSPPRGVVKIELEKHFGNGLDPKGDKVVLVDAQGVIVDQMSWGTHTAGFNPPGINPAVSRGSSTARSSLGVDTDSASDWRELRPPTPGR